MDINKLRELLSEALRLLDAEPPAQSTTEDPLIWGAKVSETFRDRVRWIGTELSVDPNHLMACMAFETGETFRADIRNAAGSGATGLIQFMPATARDLGTTTDAMARMTPEDQLRYVYHYLEPFKGRLNTLEDVYMSILWPAAVGRPNSFVLFRKGTRAYTQNRGLDTDSNEQITKAEAAGKVREKAQKGERFKG